MTINIPTWLCVVLSVSIVADSIAGIYCTILTRREDRRRSGK